MRTVLGPILPLLHERHHELWSNCVDQAQLVRSVGWRDYRSAQERVYLDIQVSAKVGHWRTLKIELAHGMGDQLAMMVITMRLSKPIVDTTRKLLNVSTLHKRWSAGPGSESLADTKSLRRWWEVRSQSRLSFALFQHARRSCRFPVKSLSTP